jgi:hypothetical protein
MKVKVGEIEIEAPDTLSAEEFGKLIDVIMLRMDKLVLAAIDVKTAVPATTTPATTTPVTETVTTV